MEDPTVVVHSTEAHLVHLLRDVSDMPSLPYGVKKALLHPRLQPYNLPPYTLGPVINM
jgi:hypothetical protein